MRCRLFHHCAIGSLGLIRLIRHVGKFNTGKVILFFLLFGIITAILLAGICIAAF